MTIDAIYRNAKVASCAEKDGVALPVAAPFRLVTDRFAKCLFRYSTFHPAVENVWMACKYRFNTERDITIQPEKLPNEIGHELLKSREDMVIANPNEMGIRGISNNVVGVAHVLKRRELRVEI